jgi:hypothetical protein
MTKIIAFSGRKQSGKSTAGEFVSSFIDNNNITLSHKIYSFADPLKQDICINILGMTHTQCYGSDDDKNTMTDLLWNGEELTARRAMEVIGTNIFRQIKTQVWVEATLNKIFREKFDLAIIVDCRFPNESDAILDSGGYVIRLDLNPFDSDSDSEKALDPEYYDWSKFSYIIHNSSLTNEEKNNRILKFLTRNSIL